MIQDYVLISIHDHFSIESKDVKAGHFLHSSGWCGKSFFNQVGWWKFEAL